MKILSKNILTIFMVLSIVFFCSCETKEEIISDINQTKKELLENGEWLLKDFEDRVMYTFTNGERATYYGESNIFPEEPILSKHIYTVQEDKITIDLNFGNIKIFHIKFSCNNNIVELYDDKGELNSTLYKRNSNYKTCL